jgi:UDP-N-acetylmuramyl pentapeptide phosphotransferase/UDP-N-acetylglucosamine-1-phosphate transferase
VIPDHPLVDLAIGALIALVVLIVTPGVAVAAILSLIVFLVIGVSAMLRRRAAGRPVFRSRASASATRRAGAARIRHRDR